ncbi:alpha-amylase family glycosyl hydrolase [Chondromyces apiculatus]|uniref:Radical SAM core domain-containing protein n=1 Tax=Chondromyces apiculatus DSM 436 TaxID=1192034 RepID=A0A017SZJ6_9BACT|nr:alpha-amylase family glycosyl hydrolase [Chondromyces apiculatus]EYF02177.1 Hypothetical protein CAP_7388 [Chondromyces apiculatus DSM 436]
MRRHLATLHLPDEGQVVFRHRPSRPVPFVDLRGDLTHWYHADPMRPVGDGHFEAVARLSAGIYGYKFALIDGGWELDAHNPRTRSVDGVQNSVLSVGGAAEPVLHAPARPWLFREDDGRVCVRAGLRRGHGEALTVRWDEGDGPRTATMALAAEEDEHLLFEVHLPASAQKLEYLFLLDDGRPVGREGGAAQAFRPEPRTLSLAPLAAPAWWREAVLYTIFVDRFRRGGAGGAGGAGGDWSTTPLQGGAGALAAAPYPPRPPEQGRAGGDLAGIVEALDHLADLGVTALHLTPLALSTSSHRYDALDPRAVDPALGGDAALQRLLDAAHRRGLKVLFDLALTHVHRDFPPFVDVRARGPDSPYWHWFRATRWPFFEGLDPGYAHYQNGAWELPLLETAHEEVIEHLAATCAAWVARGADGLRIDAAADVPLGTLRRIAREVRRARPDAVLFGEVTPDNLHRWTAGLLDAATDFGAQKALDDWLVRGRGAARASALLLRRRFYRGGPGHSALAFTATHDQMRLRTRLGDPARARLGHLLVLLRAAIPALYYGDEVGLTSASAGASADASASASASASVDASAERAFEDVWPDRLPMEWDASRWNHETLALFRSALRLRRTTRALREGDELFLPAEAADDGPAPPHVLVLRRAAGAEIIDVLLNADASPCEVRLPEGAPSFAEPRLTLGAASVDTERGTVSLGPQAAIVLRRALPPEIDLAARELLRTSRARALTAFREGDLAPLALPVHLYVTVTERCNLRCRHCITAAPRRTREGTARTLKPWLVDALGEAFAAAEYVGFVHGGESLTAGIFPEVLAALQRARQGQPTDVHLLTNGMLLDGATARRIIALGVTSVAFSLDGATASTNDALREGGSFPTIITHVRETLAARRALGADLRVGISTVVSRSAVRELPDLGRLAMDLGVDWLKVEEMVPSTPLAAHELLSPHAPAVEEAMEALREALRGSPVVLVDHRAPPTGCACEARTRPELRAFREADDYANRARFNTCRMAWEQAAVDPDGTVHPIDYDHPPVGNLLQQSLLEIWNGEAMQALRADALRRVPRARRISCPTRND